MTDYIKAARRRGMVPDWAWYQINGKTLQENYAEQHEKIRERLAAQRAAEDDTVQFTFTSEVKIK